MPKTTDSLPKCSGIYKITCLLTNQCYVGKAQNMYNRQRGHITSLNNDKHSNKRLVEAFETYKREGLAFSVVELCPITLLNLRELEWAYRLKPELNLQWVEAKSHSYYSEKRCYFSLMFGLWLSWSTGEPPSLMFTPEELAECDKVGSFYIPRQGLPPVPTKEVAFEAIEQWLKG